MTSTIIAASGLQGETTHIDMSIVGEMLRQDLGIELRLIPETDILRKLEWLKSGYIDILYYGALCPLHLEANRPEESDRYRGPFQIRLFGSSHFMAAAPAVRADSPITTIYDITADTTWATLGGSLGFFEQGVLSWIGIDPARHPQATTQGTVVPQRITHKHMEMSFQALLDGAAEVNFADAVTPWVRAVSGKSPGIRFLDLPAATDPDGAARFRQYVPFGKLTPAPRETAPEIWGKTCWIGTATLWCRDTFDEDLAYEITRWFDRNYDRFKDGGAKLLSYTRASFREVLDVAMAPVHEGSIRYFKDIGLWNEADNLRQAYNLALTTWFCRLWDESLEEATEKGISIDGNNPAWIANWSRKKTESGIPKIKQMSDQDIEEAAVPRGFTTP